MVIKIRRMRMSIFLALGILFVTFLISCNDLNHYNETLVSPSGLYELKIEVNDNKSDKTKYGCLKFSLSDKQNNLLTTLQTEASTFSKWAVAWNSNSDIIILNSHDIGTSAYKINENMVLQKIELTPVIDSIAVAAFNKKYNSK
jgi:hypothetical protein